MASRIGCSSLIMSGSTIRFLPLRALLMSAGPIDISKALKGKNLSVEPDMVKLEHPIREANTLTPVPLSLGYGIEAAVQVLVVALQGGKK